MNNSAAHSRLIADVLEAYGASPHWRIWKSATGVGRSFDNAERVMRFGLVGSGDVTGIAGNGRRIELEFKTGKARQTEQQKNFGDMIKGFGGYHAVVRGLDDASEFFNNIEQDIAGGKGWKDTTKNYRE